MRYAVLSIITLLMTFGCSQNPHSYREGQELKPSEWMYQQRVFPSGKMDQNAMKNAVGQKAKLLEKSSMTRSSFAIDNPWEFAGPTNIGGRITDVEMLQSDPNTIYAAAAAGGIFKTTDRGQTWNAIFDKQVNLAIGDMAVAEIDEDILYVGTGEVNGGGGSLSYDGDGMYKSLDAGQTWQHIGLESSGGIGKVLVHPLDADRVYVGAMGALYQNTPDRGVYKTLDGGQSWEQILSINDSTGIVDMVMTPGNPDQLFAAAWQRTRAVDQRMYGGESSGIYKSDDGGSTWRELTDGLPTKAGRIGIAISDSEPLVLYAIYADEATDHIKGVYKSIDGGESWLKLNTTGLGSVPYMWWFGKIYVDPQDSEVVYVGGLDFFKSTDGGFTWQIVFPAAHVDQHALAFNKSNPKELIIGNDGGVYHSSNGGASTTFLDGLPITQFYTVEIDNSLPQRLYGGAQDNNTVRTKTGNFDDWERILGGDGFKVLVDPNNNDYVYAEYQYGNLFRSTNGGNTFFAATAGIQGGDRHNWNTPVAFDPSNPSTMYYGSNKLYKSTNRASSWSPISADLTTNPPQSNLIFGTLTTIGVSPLDGSRIVVGADDGSVQVTIDGGNSWSNVSGDLPIRWVTAVAFDTQDMNVLYVTLSGYRYGSMTGNIYKSNDLGQTWVDISGDLPELPINDLIVLPESGNLIVATDIGVFCSEEEGSWNVLGLGLPNLVVSQLDYHAGENFVVAATYARGMYKVSLGEPSVSVDDALATTQSNITLYPNPVSTKATLSLNVRETGNYTCKIYALSGAILSEIKLGKLDEGNTQIPLDLAQLPPGNYTLHIATGGRQVGSTRFVKV